MSAPAEPLPGMATLRSAELSPCGQYRYRLTRSWDPALPVLGWVMLNPSTADAHVDDPTIRRCVGFAKRERAGGIDVANLFALRATDPSCLLYADDPLGDRNLEALGDLFRRSERVVAAWGPKYGEICRRRRRKRGVLADDRGRLVLIRDLAAECDTRLVCLGTTKDGSPRHPLYVAATQPLIPWEPAP